ncbi:hypothetical protein S40293_03244 [Stachybotrys chartarum IBT 40293]|nr:hypothetical protein S40293_03244 [Stachybotrys chartarum IBT 40293]
MASDRPLVLIVGGGWHTPANYGRLIHALEAAGHQIHCPRHPSMNGDRPPTAGFADDVRSLRAYVEQLVDDGRQILALMHSYGGQVGTEALHGLGAQIRVKQGKIGGIVHLVYMCAYALLEGHSSKLRLLHAFGDINAVLVIDKVKEMGNEDLLPLVFNFTEDNNVLCRDAKAILFEPGGASEEEVQEYLSQLVVWNGQCMYERVTKSAWRDIRTTYIHTTKDMTVPITYQKSMVETIEKEDREVRTFELDAGHCPNLTATGGVVSIIEELMK